MNPLTKLTWNLRLIVVGKLTSVRIRKRTISVANLVGYGPRHHLEEIPVATSEMAMLIRVTTQIERASYDALQSIAKHQLLRNLNGA
mmetsp:Transcript_15474/g.32051  ORF Transcript_15474/g.32051 Transcript_15474/m.32051 type:complete len:87 (+) Transcript_15474:293-553(+)